MLHRTSRNPRTTRRRSGRWLPLLGAALLAGCAGAAAPGGGPFPQLSSYAGREVAKVEFVGELAIPRDSLERVVTTRPSRCRIVVLPFCIGSFGRQRYPLDLEVLSRDVVRIQLLYRDQGYYGTRVVPTVEDEVEGDRTSDVIVRFGVTPGDLVTLQALEVRGVEGILDTARIRRVLPLKQGEPFRRIDFLASVDTIRNALLDEGHAYAQVLRNYTIDTIYDVARVELEAAPGPVVLVDTILVSGNDRLSEETVRRQLSVRRGGRVEATELVRSQRNLYELDLVRFAAVEVAPENLQVTPDSLELLEDTIGSTVLVRLVEAPRFAVDVAGGYGTLDCLRASATHTDRNFLGGARRLEVTGLVSKVGVGDPLDFGLRDNVCREFRLDSTDLPVDTAIAQALNYRLSANFTQPRLFGTRTSLLAGAHFERISEFGLYLRDSYGAQVGVVRQVAPQTLLTLNYTVERGKTEASDEFFCVVYEVCVFGDIEELRRSRWSNRVGASLSRTRVRLDPFPSAGYVARVQTDYASAAVGSDDRYLRVMADGTGYYSLTRSLVVSLRLMGGTFLDDVLDPGAGSNIPPEQRFYGGGPNSVRGFRLNQLGPRVYVSRPNPTDDDPARRDTVPSSTGGTRSVLATLEVTAPSPFLRETLRLAAFVDAGQVWDPNPDSLNPGIRFTPGVGGRLATPVGPFRLDVAYNPYDAPAGPLIVIDDDGSLAPGPREIFQPEDGRSFFQRLTFQFSLGQAF